MGLLKKWNFGANWTQKLLFLVFADKWAKIHRMNCRAKPIYHH